MLDLDKISKGLSPRIFTFLAILAVLFFILIARLFQLQVLEQKKFQKAIDSQVIRKVRITPIRGKIYSSDGKILADTQPSYNIEFYPNEFRLPPLNSTLTTRNAIDKQCKAYSEHIQHPSLLDRSQLWNDIYNKNSNTLTIFKGLSNSQTNRLKDLNLAEHYELTKDKLLLHTDKIKKLNAVGSSQRTILNIQDNIKKISDVIKRPVEITKDQISRHIRLYPALPLVVFSDLNEEELALAYEHIPQIQTQKNETGIDIRVSSKRKYPYPYIASHLLGYTARKDPQTEEDFQNYDYFRPEYIGRDGLESHFDVYLRGQGGIKTSTVNISGYEQDENSDPVSPTETENYSPDDLPPEHGQNITLTIDYKAQNIANTLLQGKVGALVAMDIKTGAIKAMASAPTFDITRRNELSYAKEISKKDKLTHPLLWPMPIRNRALNASYFPGSTVKPLVALAALKYNDIDPLETCDCDGHFELTKRATPRIRCHSVHGEVNMFEALERSCNPYFIKHALDLGVDKLGVIYEQAGIGSYPLDFANVKWNRGALPSRDQEGPKWLYADTAYVSIGQGRITASPLQVALFTAGIANEGPIMKPYILDSVKDSLNKETLQRTQPKVWRTIEAKEEHFDMVKQGMYQVVHGVKPSAKVAQIDLFKIAGKTGTAQKPYYTYKRDENGDFIYATDEEGNFELNEFGKKCVLSMKRKNFSTHGLPAMLLQTTRSMSLQ